MAAKDPQYAEGVEQRPALDRRFQSSVKGLHIIGAANGSPLLKTCINEGYEVVRAIARLMPPGDEGTDLMIIGAGPAGLSAALEARRRGYRFMVLEQDRPLNTILNFPDGKHVYAEPSMLPTLGMLGFEDSSKEELLETWGREVEDLPVERGVNVTHVQSDAGGRGFVIKTAEGPDFRATRVIVAVGRLGNPRHLGVSGEDMPCIYNKLLNPGKYRDKDIVVVGGGNSAAEAAITLCEHNRVTLVHRDVSFHVVSRVNRDQIETAREAGRLRVLLQAQATGFRDGEVDIAPAKEGLAIQEGDAPIDAQTIKQEVAFVLIGADPPTAFLKRMGVALEGHWGLSRLPHIVWVLALVYSIYGTKFGKWPFHGLYQSLNQAGADPALLYGVVYTLLITFFGMRALRKYRRDSYQVKRYGTLIAAQWLLYFLLPWGLYYIGYSEWWRSWGVTLTYPLGYYSLFEGGGTLFSGTVLPWAIASIVAFLIAMPIVSAYHGKRFCAWVCPCGGLADTLGDAWRSKAPRGRGVRRFEHASTVILVLTVLASIFIISDYRAFLAPETVKAGYKWVVDFGLASVVAITLYPFSGSRVWCRFFCPLAKWMELWGRWTGGRLSIQPNDECISCGECTRHCQMGIDVRSFAQREQPLSNQTTCCIFCGICVTVCPVDVLSVKRRSAGGGTA